MCEHDRIATMILGGMGPLTPLRTDAGKLFVASYALVSGIIFLVSVAMLMISLLHRLPHQFHLETARNG